MPQAEPFRIRSIAEYHELRLLPKPDHPLISVVDLELMQPSQDIGISRFVLELYSISIKRMSNVKFKYGQQEYDFDEGVMFFMAPGQVFGVEIGRSVPATNCGWILLIHPDFLWNTPLAKGIQEYEYFDYSVNEALFLSDKEEATITSIIRNIQQEYHANIDKFSQEIIIAQIELLLTYSERFYNRQFITRKITNHKILNQLEEILDEYFQGDDLMKKGLPSVQQIADKLEVSPNYLSGLLKVLTGFSTQQHIHEKVIQRAKEKLSTTNMSVREIAYQLGFEYSQSFNKFFKGKTNLSPLEFRRSFVR